MKRLMTCLLVLSIALPAFAAELTTAQLQALKSDINTNFAPQWAAGDAAGIAAAYNAEASPAFTVWKSSLDASSYRDQITWTELTARTAGERDMFSFLTDNGSAPLMCSKINVRQAIQDAFSGAGGVTTRTALIAACKRLVTRGERLFATGTGTNATPGALVVEGDITEQNVLEAMGL